MVDIFIGKFIQFFFLNKLFLKEGKAKKLDLLKRYIFQLFIFVLSTDQICLETFFFNKNPSSPCVAMLGSKKGNIFYMQKLKNGLSSSLSRQFS